MIFYARNNNSHRDGQRPATPPMFFKQYSSENNAIRRAVPW